MNRAPSPITRSPTWRSPGRLEHWLHNLLDGRCRFCAARSPRHPLCAGCREDLPWITAACRRCGLPLASGASECAGCLSKPPPFDRTRALWTYTDGVDRLIRAFKLRGDFSAGRLLTSIAAGAMRERTTPCHAPLLPMPLHPVRYRQRGFNQSALIAGWLGPPVIGRLVQRRRNTPPQRGLDAATRQRNLSGAFRLQCPPPRSVVLVDDVLTTGASLRELANCLRSGGTERIEVIVLARAI
ncbi:ComF family protein [Spiribacter sp. 221]|uniref:double zinc ribbon domain-containing protein n=1 Tax=Spiribacter onubensis TaxID=3122420 RepID=UPI00349FC097